MSCDADDCLSKVIVASDGQFCRRKLIILATASLIMDTGRYKLRPRATSIPRSGLPSSASRPESQAGTCVSLTGEIRVGRTREDALDFPAECPGAVDVVAEMDIGQCGQAWPASQEIATLDTQLFSSSTPRESEVLSPLPGQTVGLVEPDNRSNKSSDRATGSPTLALERGTMEPNSSLTLASYGGASDPSDFSGPPHLSSETILTLFSDVEPTVTDAVSASCSTNIDFRSDFDDLCMSTQGPSLSKPAAPASLSLAEPPAAADVRQPSAAADRDGSPTTHVDLEASVINPSASSAFKYPPTLPLRSPVFGAAQRPSTPFYSQVSATRTDIRLRHGSSEVVATQSTLALARDTSTRSSSQRPLASAGIAGLRRVPGEPSPRSSVESWLRNTPSPNLVAPPPSSDAARPACSAVSSRHSALQATLPLGADAAALAKSRPSSARTLRSGRSSLAIEVINLSNRMSDNLTHLASQIQCDAIARENQMRDDANLREQKLREDAFQREQILRDEKLRSEEIAVRREEGIRADNLKRENMLAQMKLESERLCSERERTQAELVVKEKQALLDSELRRCQTQVEAHGLVEKDRIEAEVRRERAQMEFQQKLHEQFEKQRACEKELWGSETNRLVDLERRLALEQQKTSLLQKQAEIEKLHAEKDKALFESCFTRVAAPSAHSDSADTSGSSDSPPRAKQTRFSVDTSPTSSAAAAATRAPWLYTPLATEISVQAPPSAVSAFVCDVGPSMSLAYGCTVPTLASACTPVYVQCSVPRPSPSVLPYVDMYSGRLPGQAPSINYVAQPPGPPLAAIPTGPNVGLASSLTGLAVQPLFTQSPLSQPLFTQPPHAQLPYTGLPCTQPPLSSGMGLPQAPSFASVGPQAPSAQSSAIADIKTVSSCVDSSVTSAALAQSSNVVSVLQAPPSVGNTSTCVSGVSASAPSATAMPSASAGGLAGEAKGEIPAQTEVRTISSPSLPAIVIRQTEPVKPYCGNSSYKIYREYFSRLSNINDWQTKTEKAQRLLLAMEGAAAEAVRGIDAHAENAYEQIWEALERRFGFECEPERAMRRFDARIQFDHETVQMYEQALRSIYREAWPDADPKLKDSHLQRHFVNGIADPGLQHYLRLHARTDDFAETVAKARRYMDAQELTKTTKKPSIKVASVPIQEDGSQTQSILDGLQQVLQTVLGGQGSCTAATPVAYGRKPSSRPSDVAVSRNAGSNDRRTPSPAPSGSSVGHSSQESAFSRRVRFQDGTSGDHQRPPDSGGRGRGRVDNRGRGDDRRPVDRGVHQAAGRDNRGQDRDRGRGPPTPPPYGNRSSGNGTSRWGQSSNWSGNNGSSSGRDRPTAPSSPSTSQWNNSRNWSDRPWRPPADDYRDRRPLRPFNAEPRPRWGSVPYSGRSFEQRPPPNSRPGGQENRPPWRDGSWRGVCFVCGQFGCHSSLHGDYNVERSSASRQDETTATAPAQQARVPNPHSGLADRSVSSLNWQRDPSWGGRVPHTPRPRSQ